MFIIIIIIFAHGKNKASRMQMWASVGAESGGPQKLPEVQEIRLEDEMTVLEANQAYRAAMNILKDARMKALAENNDVVYQVLCHAGDSLTNREHKDMKASFQQ
jgi:hypothetical protein